MPITFAQIIVWLIVGLVGGTLAGILVKRQRTGFGLWTNLGIGLVGALVGGFLFWAFNLLPTRDEVSISLRDVAAALVGSLLFLLGWWVWQNLVR